MDTRVTGANTWPVRRARGAARRGRQRTAAVGAVLLHAVLGIAAAAQVPVLTEPSPAPESAVLRVGERLQYGLSLGPIHAGRAHLEVGAATTVRGSPAYPVTLIISGGAPFFRLEDRLRSWVALRPLRTLRSERRIHEGPRRSATRIEMDAGTGRYRRVALDDDGSASASGNGERSGPMPEAPLDDLAVLFLPRTLPLEPGATYRVPRYFVGDRNPIVLRVVGRDRVRTPAGTFRVVDVSVAIEGSGLFAPERHARVLVTDDERRTVVRLTTATALGPLKLYLTGRAEPAPSTDPTPAPAGGRRGFTGS